MRDYSKEYEVKKMKVEQLLDLIEDNDFIFTPMAASMPQKIMNNMQYLKKTGVKKYLLKILLELIYYTALENYLILYVLLLVIW